MRAKKGMKKMGILGLCAVVAMAMLFMTACDKGLPYSEYKLGDYIKVGVYKGLYLEEYSINVSKKEVKAKINEALEAAAEKKELDKGAAVKNGDTVNIDYVGKVDGKKVVGGSAQGYDLTLGSGQFIDGFESGLVGKKVGDKKIKLNVTFPDYYQTESLQGKEAVFTVNINSATRLIKPKFDNAFAKSQGDYKNKKEYREAIKKQIYEQKELQAKEDQRVTLWDEVVSGSKVKQYPEKEVELYKEANSKQMDSMAEEYGVSRNEVLSQYGFTDEKGFEISNDEASKLRVKQELIIMKIAEDEGLTVKDKDKENMINDLETQGFTAEMVEQQTGRTMDDYAYIQVLYEKVLDLILDNAKAK